jgi:hypothetical protein
MYACSAVIEPAMELEHHSLIQIESELAYLVNF